MAFKDWPPILQTFAKVSLVVLLLTIYNSTVHSIVTWVGYAFALPITSWQVTRLLRRTVIKKKMLSPRDKSVLVTGCDSGFGLLISKKLDARGYHVFAGCLFPDGDGAQELKRCCSKRLTVLKLDVTNDCEVSNAVNAIKKSSTPDLWGVVNNAGIAAYIPAEFGAGTEDLDRILSVNVHGVVRVTKACLPLIRKSKGRVVNVASMMGRFSFSGLSQYCMSKFAVRAFSDSLRREMYSFGVKVITIEPMMYATNIMNTENILSCIDKTWMRTDDTVKEDYGSDFLERFKKRALTSLKTCRKETFEVVNAVTDGIQLEDPEVYYRCCGLGERPALWAAEMLPEIAQDVALTGKVWAKFISIYSNKST